MTVRQLLDTIDSDELSEWIAFHQIYPFGEERADWRAGNVAAMVYNVNRDKKTKAIGPGEFIYEHKEPRRMTGEEIGLKLLQLTGLQAMRPK